MNKWEVSHLLVSAHETWSRVDSREKRGTPLSLLHPPPPKEKKENEKKLFKRGTVHNIPFISEKSSFSAACFPNIRGSQ